MQNNSNAVIYNGKTIDELKNNPNAEIYNGKTIDELEKELTKTDLVTEDRSLLIHIIASKRAGNNNAASQPTAVKIAEPVKK